MDPPPPPRLPSQPNFTSIQRTHTTETALGLEVRSDEQSVSRYIVVGGATMSVIPDAVMARCSI